jgi:hypothetical protein
MTVDCDFRELLTRSVKTGLKVWDIPETMVPPKTVKELSRLGDEATFLSAIGITSDEYKEYPLPPPSFFDSDIATSILGHEGERWKVSNFVSAAQKALQPIGNSLAEDSAPARVGRLLRALPLIAASRFSNIGSRLARILGVDSKPEALVIAYSKVFSQYDEEKLAAVDRLILDDTVLGPLAVELAGRLMLKFNCDATYLDKDSREALINCLTLLISGDKQQKGFTGTTTMGQDVEEDVT